MFDPDTGLFQRFSGLSQTFRVPAGAAAIQFTVASADLVADESAPVDAFEVALLDADSHASLSATAAGLDDTDALLNIQSNGSTVASPLVSVPGLLASGDILSLAEPLTIDISLDGVAAGTMAILQFYLLGFGVLNSQIAIDDVTILGAPPPEARNDHVETFEDTPVTVDVLANDQDADGLLDATSVVIQQPPEHGTVEVNADGTVQYIPDADFGGYDHFLYAVADNAELLSNSAAVIVHVLPVADEPFLVVSPAEGDQDSRIPLTISARARDYDGSESIAIEISDVPVGAELSRGLLVAPNVYQVQPEELAGLTIIPPMGSVDSFELTVTARAEEAEKGDVAESVLTLPVTVNFVFTPLVEIEEFARLSDRRAAGH